MSKKSANVISDIATSSLVVKPIKVQEKPKINTFQCSSSENRLKVSSKGFKEKIVNKVRSWSSRDKYSVNEHIHVETRLPDSSRTEEDIENELMENLAHSNLTRARDSLESLHERNVPNDDWRPRSCTLTPKSVSKNPPDSPKSSPDTSKTAKSPFWDPFDKRGRKNRKDFNRKKKKNNAEIPKQESSSIPIEGKSCLTKPNEKEDNDNDHCETVEEEYPYKYKYFPKNSKSVVFTNEVFVVYFQENDIVYESKEPLKKDIEQQERNKEMRQGHLVKTQEKYNLCLY
ncbi:hypothetical protein JTB14_027995 [Gonioctena quinquepunctata]|nr:hypothetical protein JTB14_027995 [Gonioctena quinquepunctata]